jgi:large subunit ribosomal protein L3
MEGIIGRKVGMTRIFHDESGHSIPVTVVETGANVVHQVKTVERDGYAAVQLGFEPVAETKVSKAVAGHCKKHNSEPTRITREFHLSSPDEQVEPGQKVGPEFFDGVRFVDVTGISKGRGFAGTVKRHNFQRGRETHGNTNHRERGSLGAGTYPARVFPGVRMAGHMGAERVTVKGLEVVGVNKDAGLVYIRGSIPGARRGIVFLRKNLAKEV